MSCLVSPLPKQSKPLFLVSSFSQLIIRETERESPCSRARQLNDTSLLLSVKKLEGTFLPLSDTLKGMISDSDGKFGRGKSRPFSRLSKKKMIIFPPF